MAGERRYVQTGEQIKMKLYMTQSIRNTHSHKNHTRPVLTPCAPTKPVNFSDTQRQCIINWTDKEGITQESTYSSLFSSDPRSEASIAYFTHKNDIRDTLVCWYCPEVHSNGFPVSPPVV